MYDFQIDEIAHAIVSDRHGMAKVLKSMNLDLIDESDEERIIRLVLEHKRDERVYREMVRIHNEKPYHRHCLHCYDAIKPVIDKGIEVRRSMAKEKLEGK